MSSLTFGPEWLRALSGGDGSEAQTKTLTTKRFKLADFRYSKEDMLELFEENISIPIDLKEFGDVIMQETQNQPLSFIPLSKDEERLLVAGINSSVLFRLSGRGAPLRGRGAIRGARGRGRGDGQANFYRTLSNEESNFNSSREPYQRRPWGEGARGGSSDRGSGRGEPPGGRGASFEQRGRIPSDRGGLTDREAWRGSQEEDDGGGWRVSGQRSWRKGSADASSNWRTDSVKDEGTDNQNKRTWSNNGTYWRQLSSSSNSGLPEWCDDDVDQDVGTFDASGQFKSMKPSEDSASKYEKEEGDQPVFDEPQEKSNGEAGKKLETDAISKLENKKEKGGIEHNDESKRERLPPSHVNGNSSNSASKTSLQDIGCEESRKSKPLTVEEIESSALAQTESQSKSQNELRVVNSRSSQNDENLTMEDVNAAANGMQKILTAGQAQRGRHPNVDEDADHNIDHIKNLIEKLDDEIDNIYPTNQLSGPDQEVDDCNITDPSIVCAKKAEPGVLIKGMQDWIYRDPQGEIQGPFSSEEMLQWFKAGYFTMGLLVRRVCDEIFLPLGDLIKLWNRVPFQPGPELPSITSQIYAAQLLRRQQQEEYKMMLMQQQRKMQQQQHHHQQQQQQLQFQQQEMLLLQQMKEQQQQQQMKEMQQRPHNLNVSQEVSIWGDSPAPSPNLVSTPWSPTSSQPELLTWNASKSQNVASEAHKHQGQSTGKSDQTKVSDATTKGSQGDECDDSSMLESEESAGGSTSQEAENDARHNGSASKSEEDQDQKTTGQSSQKNKEKKKKKKQDTDKKKKEERDKEQRKEEEDRKALEEAERQQQEALAKQTRKDLEENQQQQAAVEMQQQQYKQQQYRQKQQQQQQQQQHALQQQQQKQQQQQYQMLLQQKQRQEQALLHQQDQQRLHVNEAPSWNVPVTSVAPSLAEIQRMEEERQMINREKMKRIQAHEQQLHQQQQRSGAGWSDKSGQPVMSLRQIQEEEARKLKALQRNQHNLQPKTTHGIAASSVWNSKQGMNYASYDTHSTASFWDDVMNSGPSPQAPSHFHQMNSRPRPVSESAFPSLPAAGKQNKKFKDEELVHRLFQQTSPCDDFVQWVNRNMPEISKYVDVPTFVRFLQDIDSPYEIHEYIRSYFGESQDTQIFAKEFLEWKRRSRNQHSPHFVPVGLNTDLAANSDIMANDSDEVKANKKKLKKRMQKVNPNLLGFSCNADPGIVNRGEIHSATDAWNMK